MGPVLEPRAPSVMASIRVDLHDDGAISIHGAVGDVRMALQMLDAAREAVARQLGKPSILEPWGRGLAVPAVDVGAEPSPLYPVQPLGDAAVRR